MQELASKYIPAFLKQAHSGSVPSLTSPETGPGLLFIPAVPMALVITVVSPANATEAICEKWLL